MTTVFDVSLTWWRARYTVWAMLFHFSKTSMTFLRYIRVISVPLLDKSSVRAVCGLALFFWNVKPGSFWCLKLTNSLVKFVSLYMTAFNIPSTKYDLSWCVSWLHPNHPTSATKLVMMLNTKVKNIIRMIGDKLEHDDLKSTDVKTSS